MSTSSIRHPDPPQGIAAGAKPTSLVRLRTVAKLLRPLYQRLHLSLDGLDAMEGTRGVHLRVRPSAVGSFPFECTVVDGGVNVRHGNYGDMAIPDTVVAPPSSGTGSIWLQITFTVVTNGDGSKVLGGTVTDVTIDTGDTKPTDGDTIKYLQIAPTQDGLPMGNDVRFSLEYKICDDGSGEGRGELKHGISG